jgi:hypothetical protein
MKYYSLKYSSDTKEIGRRFPQSIKFMTRMGSIQEDGIGQFGPINEEKFILPDLELSKTAKVTNLISSAGIVGSRFLIINKELLATFREFNLGLHQFWPIDVWWKGNKLEDYFLFHLSYPSNDEWIDFSKTIFHLKVNGTDEVVDSKRVNNISELWNLLHTPVDGKILIPTPKDIFIHPNKTSYDLVRITFWSHGINGYFVSDRLKEEIEKRKLTGMHFIPLNEVDNRVVLI